MKKLLVFGMVLFVILFLGNHFIFKTYPQVLWREFVGSAFGFVPAVEYGVGILIHRACIALDRFTKRLFGVTE